MIHDPYNVKIINAQQAKIIGIYEKCQDNKCPIGKDNRYI